MLKCNDIDVCLCVGNVPSPAYDMQIQTHALKTVLIGVFFYFVCIATDD